MRLSFFAVLSGLAAPAIVNAYPVQNWMHKRLDPTPSVYPSEPTDHHHETSTGYPPMSTSLHHDYNGTTSTDSPEPTSTPPQNCCVTPGVPPLCTECGPHHDGTSPVLVTRVTPSAIGLAQKHPDQFLSELVFQGLLVDEFKFGRGSSGKVGSNMISQYVVVPSQTQPGGLKPTTPGQNELAIHLNCVVTASALQGNSLTIHAEMFHLTARSLASQKLIDTHGPSAITADKSIHINVNTGWGRQDNLKALANEVMVNKDQSLHYEIHTKQGYSNAYMRGLVKEFRAKVEQHIHQLLGGNVVVHWTGDKTFPTQ